MSSLRSPSELPESFQRAFSSWANYSSLELLVKTPICHLLLCLHYFHWQVSLFDSQLVLPCVLAFLQVLKVFLAFCIDKFNKTCSGFICTVEQFDVFLVCVFLLSCLCYCLKFTHHEITNMQKQFLFLSWFTMAMESPSWLIIQKTLSCKIIYHWIPNWNTPLKKCFFSINSELELFVVYGVLSLQRCVPSWQNNIFNIWIFRRQWSIN